jgi:hypothetical protein
MITHELRDADGTLLAIGGFAFPYAGLAEAWIKLTDAGKARPIKLVRWFRRMLASLIAEHQPRRVQATVVDGDEITLRLDTWLGFKHESVMPLYGPNGETCHRLVLFPPNASPTTAKPIQPPPKRRYPPTQEGE